MSSSLALTLVTAGGLLMVALASAAEVVLTVAARGSLRDIVDRAAWRDEAVERLLDEPVRTWATLTVLFAAGWLLSGAGAAALAAGLAPSNLVAVLAFALFGVAAVVLCQLLPRSLSVRQPALAAYLVARPLRVASVLLLPLSAPVSAFALRSRRLGSDLVAASFLARSADDPRQLVEAGEEEGLIEEDEKEMIVGIFELGDTKVREVMVPRIDMVAIPEDVELETALDTIISAGHSRIPVYRESLDNISGLLYAKDLLRAFRNRDLHPDLPSMLRDPYFVPESKTVDELLEELQLRKVHMAIVVDEYGGTAGLVTIEDLLEEIVGEIQDEYDTEESRIELLSADEGLFHAGVDIDDVNRLMDIELPTEDGDTLAGLVFTRLGKVPEAGEKAVFDDAVIEVLAVSGRRIHRVRVSRRSHAADGAAIDVAEEPTG